MVKAKEIPLFWWSETRLMDKKLENYGDLISPYLAAKISGRKINWINPAKKNWFRKTPLNYLSIGSILQYANKNSIVWGSGIIDRQFKVKPAVFKAVRGPETRSFLLESGLSCPPVYGDPALLLPLYYKPQVEKEFSIGIVPHYVDIEAAKEMFSENPNVKVINLMTLDVEQTTREILQCEKVISTSLHGGIVAHAYGIPAVFAKLGNRLYGSGIKFKDYLTSVGLQNYEIPDLTNDYEKLFHDYENLIDPTILSSIQKGLLESCPFSENN